MWKKHDLESALGKIIQNPKHNFGKIEFNSNDIVNGDIFIALSEGKGDGHNYTKHALDKGAQLIIVERKILNIPEKHQLIVENSLKSLYKIAEFRKKQTNAKIIAITGSVGKTTTRYILQEILSQHNKKVFTPKKNFNNYIGVPLSLASMPIESEFGIFELGMNQANDISPLSQLIKPDISIITDISPSHIENFASLEKLSESKMEIIDGMNKEKGLIILTGDNKLTPYMIRYIKNKNFNKIMTFGAKQHNNIIANNYMESNNTSFFDIITTQNNKKYNIKTKLKGKHNILNIASSLMTIDQLQINIEKSVEIIKELSNIKGRGNIIQTKLNNHNINIIDHTYNAPMKSMEAMIQETKYIKGYITIILGHMSELGEKSKNYHMSLLNSILNKPPQQIIFIGSNIKCLFQELLKHQQIKSHYFESTTILLKNISQLIKETDYLVIKGSNSLKLNLIIEYLTQKK